MRRGTPKEVHEIGLELTKFLYEKDKGQSVTALIVATSLMIKKRSETYTAFRNLRQEVVERLMDLTDLDEKEFKETSHLLKELKDAA